MQNGAQNNLSSLLSGGRLLGFVRVVVGAHVFDLPVQAVPFEKDGDRAAGGLFESDGQLGIIVDEAASQPQVQAQIEQATAQAVRHLSQKYLN
jgi:hypothetical protein